jgi:hypothetical protein
MQFYTTNYTLFISDQRVVLSPDVEVFSLVYDCSKMRPGQI